MGEELLKVVNLKKRFGRVEALKGVSFTMERGQVVGLVGDNGAGKSTLAKIIIGYLKPDEGEVYFEGKRVSWSSPLEARSAGIEMVYQDLALVDVMSVARNFFLGREPVKNKGLQLLDFKRMNEECMRTLKDIGIKLRSPHVMVSSLSGGERQAVAVARAVYFRAKLVILDEPTANLSVREALKVLELVKELRERGISSIFITHNIYHVYEVADKFVILDKGRKIAEYQKEGVTPQEIIETIKYGKPVVETVK